MSVLSGLPVCRAHRLAFTNIFTPSVSDISRHGASLIAQLVKNPPAMQETPVRFLGQEDPLEKRKATHSSILAWRIPRAVYSMG